MVPLHFLFLLANRSWRIIASDIAGRQHFLTTLHVLGFKQTLQIIACQSLQIHSAIANLCRLIQPLLASLSKFL